MPIQKVDITFQPSLFELEETENGDISPEEARRISENALVSFRERVRQIVVMSERERDEAGVSTPTYYEQFLALMDAGWPWRVAAYIAWASSPKQGRWPKTQDEFAQTVLGLTSDRQIAKWRKNNPSINDLIADLQVAPMLEHRADVIKALIESASDPDYKGHGDRKLFLEITGDYTPTSKLVAQLRRSLGDQTAEQPNDVLEQYAGFDDAGDE
jgi:hypothetical protein